MKDGPDSMTTKVLDGGKASWHDMVLNNGTNILVIIAWPAKVHGRNPTIVGGLQQLFARLVGLSRDKHF